MKTYFNDGIIGNSSLLGCIHKNGELVRLFWPNIDYSQHVESFQMGILSDKFGYNTKWLHSNDFIHSQEYIEDTNILNTKYSSNDILVSCIDYTLTDKDIIIRSIKIKNTSEENQNISFLVYSNLISNNTDLRSTLFDFDTKALIHYRHDNYIGITSNTILKSFQIGNNPYEACKNGELYGINDIGMTSEGAMRWDLLNIAPNEEKTIDIFIICAKNINECINDINIIKDSGLQLLEDNTKKYWYDYLKRGKQINTKYKLLNDLYKRSLLTVKLMNDSKSGALLAAPEIDETFSKCGRYAYCWGRDAAFITTALDMAGYSDIVDSFYKWASSTQAKNGSWYQRYYMDGNIAPSWGLQIDETGTILWGIFKHYKTTKDINFLKDMWEAIKKGADFLATFIEPSNNLPKPTYDLWEERMGQHTYSASAVYGGLIAAYEISKLLNKKDENQEIWFDTANKIKNSIDTVLWDKVGNRFFRGVNSKVEGWGFEGHGGKKEIQVNDMGYKISVSALDIMVDISLLGVVIPFEVLEYNNEKVINTVKQIEEKLIFCDIGGIKRYETDNYMGGNPWIITTLWKALYDIKMKEYKKAEDALWWAANHATNLGFLPEQIDKETGKPAWIIPLTWSHAMFVHVLLELVDIGRL